MDVPTDCLWCGAALATPIEAQNRCPACGRGNRKDDLRIYRTRRFAARRAEAALKVVAVLLVGGGALAAMLNVMKLRYHDELVLPILGPIVGGMLLWYLAGYVTLRRSGRFPALLVLALFAAPFVYVLVPLLFVPVIVVCMVFMARSWYRARA